MTKKTRQELALHRQTLNKIDDYFEYRNESESDRKFIHSVLDEFTTKLHALHSQKSRDENE